MLDNPIGLIGHRNLAQIGHHPEISLHRQLRVEGRVFGQVADEPAKEQRAADLVVALALLVDARDRWRLAAARPEVSALSSAGEARRSRECRFFADPGAPFVRARMLAPDRGVEDLLELPRDGARGAPADLSEVDLAERDALGRRAAHEDFICDVKLVT